MIFLLFISAVVALGATVLVEAAIRGEESVGIKAVDEVRELTKLSFEPLVASILGVSGLLVIWSGGRLLLRLITSIL